MKALVTGAGGFVGKYLTAILIENDIKVLGIDRKDCDISDFNSLVKIVSDFKPDVVYHLAALAYVPDCEEDFAEALKTNVLGTYNIVKAAKDSKIIFISTANIYGYVTEVELPLSELSPIKPANNYALSKSMAEDIVKTYARDYVIFRPFNHIGVGQNENYVVTSFAKQLAEIKAGKKEAVFKVGNLSAERDFLAVEDVVKAYLAAATKGYGVYNLCSGHALSIQEILDKLIKIAGVEVNIQIDPERYRENDLPVLYGTYKKAEDELGWEPEVSLEIVLQAIFNSQ